LASQPVAEPGPIRDGGDPAHERAADAEDMQMHGDQVRGIVG
jgi:hypothetical protein